MGGTWSLWLANEAELKALRARPQNDRTRASTREAVRKQTLLFQCVMYDLTMWNSIANDKRTRYASSYVTRFIKDFGLENEDIPSPAAEDSTDDDDPPPPETLTRAERAERAAAAKVAADAAAAARKAELDAIFPDSD